jgi:para-aminobenzoate synthetase component 1
MPEPPLNHPWRTPDPLKADQPTRFEMASAQVEELLPAPEVEAALLQFAGLPHCALLDSAMPDEHIGRFSFLAADPFAWIEAPADGTDGLAMLAERMAGLRAETIAGLPPFQGGAAMMLSYDLAHSLERLPRLHRDDFPMPALAAGLYDVVLAWDRAAGRAWLISQGLPETEPAARRRRAAERLAQFRALLSQSDAASPLRNAAGTAPPPAKLTCNFSRGEYLRAVQRAIDYIYAGDVFQVNLAQRLAIPMREDPLTTYLRLRRCNPAPMAGYFDLGRRQILSASPERFLRVAGREVETRPIKGTRPRTGEPAADDRAVADLRGSEKDRAENVMIVDLLRNDLSRVCEPASVRVEVLCRVEAYRHVFHLVSTVCGRLRAECGPLDLVRAAFPGGSITGAPKVRAMEIIAELEPTARGAYCGSLGYLGFDGAMDLNILIRTITAADGWLTFGVGGGIVAQSQPEREYDETWQKAQGLLQAVGGEA